jgi:tetratricopeptide (TPR) repeat protein
MCLATLCIAQPDKAAIVAEGYEAFYNLEYEPAIASFERALALDPADPRLHNHLAEGLLFRELFRNGALESEIVTGNNSFVRRVSMEPSPAAEQRFMSEIELSIKLCADRLASAPHDTATMHTMAVAIGLRANYGFLVRKTWLASLSDSSKAQKLDREVTALDPSNYDARLIPGTYDYVVGSLPLYMRALSFVAGYHGDKNRGIATLEEVATRGNESRHDAEVVLCALYRREGQPRRAVPRVLSMTQRYPRNYIVRFELSQMYATAGMRREALDVMSEVARLQEENAPGFGRIPPQKIAYETGNLQFWFGDLDNAMTNFRRATATGEGMKELDLNTGALAFMRQGQIYDLRHQHWLAAPAYRRAIAFAPEAEAAKESKRYLSSPYRKTAA